MGTSLNHSANFLIALGSNLKFDGVCPTNVLEQAFAALESEGFAIRVKSRFFETPAFPAGAGPNFVNAAAVIESELNSRQVLERLHAVEAQMGRERVQRWGARTLDLDLLAAGRLVLPDAKTHQYWTDLPLEAQKQTAPSELILPHPRLSERAFVLVPLMDVAPDWVHPVSKMSVKQMHDALPKGLRDEVVPL